MNIIMKIIEIYDNRWNINIFIYLLYIWYGTIVTMNIYSSIVGRLVFCHQTRIIFWHLEKTNVCFRLALCIWFESDSQTVNKLSVPTQISPPYLLYIFHPSSLSSKSSNFATGYIKSRGLARPFAPKN